MWLVTFKMKHIKEINVFHLDSLCIVLTFETVLMSVNSVAHWFLLDSQDLNITLRFPGTHKKAFFFAEEGTFNVS